MRWFVCSRLQVSKLTKNELLMVNIGSLSTGGRVAAVKADLAKIVLTQPVCTSVGEKIALSRRVARHWRCVLMSKGRARRWRRSFSQRARPRGSLFLLGLIGGLFTPCSLIGWGQINKGVSIKLAGE
jgi:hypothetical protein